MEESDYFQSKSTLTDFGSVEIEAEEARRSAIRSFYASNLHESTSCKDMLDIASKVILNDSDVNALEAVKVLYEVLKGDKCLNTAALDVFFDTIPKALYQNLLSYDFCPPRPFKSGNCHAINSVKFALEMPCILMLASNACPQALVKFYEPLLVILFRFMESKVSQKCEQQELVISAQIRSLSFVCYTFKNGIMFSSPISVECFSQRTINLIKSFLVLLPSHACDQRRSILEILRTFVTSQCGLWKELAPLLDEQLLAGHGKAQQDFCRPLALQVMLEILLALKGRYATINMDEIVKSLTQALYDRALLPNAHLAAAKSLALLMEHLSHSHQEMVLCSFTLLLENTANKFVTKPPGSKPSAALAPATPTPTVLWLCRLAAANLSQGFDHLSAEVQERGLQALALLSSSTRDPEIVDSFCTIVTSNSATACCFWWTLHQSSLDLQSILRMLEEQQQKRGESSEASPQHDLLERLGRMAPALEAVAPDALEVLDERIASQYLQTNSFRLDECELRPEVWLDRLRRVGPSREGLLEGLLSLEACQPEWPLVLAAALPKSPPQALSAQHLGVFKRLLKQLPRATLSCSIDQCKWLRRVALECLERPAGAPGHREARMAYQSEECEALFIGGIFSEYLTGNSPDKPQIGVIPSAEQLQDVLSASARSSEVFYQDIIYGSSSEPVPSDDEIYLRFATLVMSKYCNKAQREMAASAFESGRKKGKNMFTLLSCSSCGPPEVLEPLISAVRNLAFIAIASDPSSESSIAYYPAVLYLAADKPAATEAAGASGGISSLGDLVNYVEASGSSRVFVNAIRGAICALDLRPTHIVGTIRAVQFICAIASSGKCPWAEILEALVSASFGVGRGGAVYALTHALCSRQKEGLLDPELLPIEAILEAVFAVVKSDNVYTRVLEAKIALRALQVLSSMLRGSQQRLLGEFLYKCFYSPTPFVRCLALRFYTPERYGPGFDAFRRAFDRDYPASSPSKGQDWRGRPSFTAISPGDRAGVISFFESNLVPLGHSVHAHSFAEALSQLQVELRYLAKAKISVQKISVQKSSVQRCGALQSHARICGLLKLLCVTFDAARAAEGEGFAGLIQRLPASTAKLLYTYTLALEAPSDRVVDFGTFESCILPVCQTIAKLGATALSHLDTEMKTLDALVANVCLFATSPGLLTPEFMQGIISSSTVLLKNVSPVLVPICANNDVLNMCYSVAISSICISSRSRINTTFQAHWHGSLKRLTNLRMFQRTCRKRFALSLQI